MSYKSLRALMLMAFVTIGSAFAYADGNVYPPFPGGKTYLFRVTLTDKQGTPYSISKPLEFLSEKSVQRRKRQGLPVDSTDLPIPPAYLKEISATPKVEIVCMSKWNNTVLVKVHDMADVLPLMEKPFVEKMDHVYTSPDSISPSTRVFYRKELDPYKDGEDEYGRAAVNIDLMNGRELHKMGFRGKGITIAVFDGGFMNVDSIPAFKNVHILGKKDFVAFKSQNICIEGDHGTRVLSTMALDVKGAFVGTAPDADYWLFRTEDNYTEFPAEEDYWAAAAEYADSLGVDIISSSLGYQDFDDHALDHKYYELDGNHSLISRTSSRLSSKGIIHVNSAGNEGNDSWKKIGFPADARDILAVGAVTRKRINANFSSVGPSDDGRVKPDVMALGSAAATIGGRGTANSDMGTSFACPITAGMVASLWQSAPDKTAHEVMDAVRRSGDNYETPNNVFGYGIPDFIKAYHILKGQ